MNLVVVLYNTYSTNFRSLAALAVQEIVLFYVMFFLKYLGFLLKLKKP